MITLKIVVVRAAEAWNIELDESTYITSVAQLSALVIHPHDDALNEDCILLTIGNISVININCHDRRCMA